MLLFLLYGTKGGDSAYWFAGFRPVAGVAIGVAFHFWLADAHAVAPTPVCVLFSGVMVELTGAL